MNLPELKFVFKFIIYATVLVYSLIVEKNPYIIAIFINTLVILTWIEINRLEYSSKEAVWTKNKETDDEE